VKFNFGIKGEYISSKGASKGEGGKDGGTRAAQWTQGRVFAVLTGERKKLTPVGRTQKEEKGTKNGSALSKGKQWTWGRARLQGRKLCGKEPRFVFRSCSKETAQLDE